MPKKNVTIHGDALESLWEVQERLSREFGFPLTLSQTIKHLVRLYLARHPSLPN